MTLYDDILKSSNSKMVHNRAIVTIPD